MSYLLIVVLNHLDRMPALLEAWQAIGISGVTMMESAGSHRARTWLSTMGLEALGRLFKVDEVQTCTLFTALDREDLLARAIAEAERVVGGFEQPESGLLMVLPVAQIRGLHKVKPTDTPASSLPAIQSQWMIQRDTPIRVAAETLNLQPTVVAPDTPLDDVARAMLASPNVHVACVVAEDGRSAQPAPAC
jgi:hypothetical protein